MTIYIQDVLNNNTNRGAKTILRKAIQEVASGQRTHNDVVTRIVSGAKESRLVNEATHPHTRQIESVTFNQILDRMNLPALCHVLFLSGGQDARDNGLEAMVNAFIDESVEATTWPFSKDLVAPVVAGNEYLTDVEITALLDVTTASSQEDFTQQILAAKTSTSTPWDEELLTIANMAADRATNGDVKSIYDMYETVGALTGVVEELRSRPTAIAPQQVQATGDIPNGKPRREKASKVFKHKHKLLDFDITVYDWDGVNPLVPSKMPHFKFDVDVLADALWARERKQNAWFVGHTGTGKSTNVEQICAYTGNMFQRVNFDSDITRLEFVGKVDVTTNEAGEQVTSFTDGILPIAMQMPCILMLDEADAVRGDIAYVLQPVLEGKSLRLLEDGGRMVEPHPEFCIMATANTVGAGDSTGMYSAAVKMQSKAAMNRYNIFIHVDYMKVSDEMDMIRKVVPDVHEKTIESLDKFVTAYRSAINIGEITAPISPRNTITIAQYTTDFHGRIGVTQAFKRALERNLFNSMDEGERAIAVGIADRVLA